jgi:hypothetical protein
MDFFALSGAYRLPEKLKELFGSEEAVVLTASGPKRQAGSVPRAELVRQPTSAGARLTRSEGLQAVLTRRDRARPLEAIHGELVHEQSANPGSATSASTPNGRL